MIKLCTFAVALLFVGVSAAWGDSWPNAGVRIFAEKDGRLGLKVIPVRTAMNSHAGEVQARGVLFGLDDNGTEVVSWDKTLVNIPVIALVSNRNHCVVTLDTWGNMGYEHALVIYGAKGELIADFKLTNLLSKEEIEKKINQSVSSRNWRWESDIQIDEPAGQLVITLKWGKRITIDLKSGKVV